MEAIEVWERFRKENNISEDTPCKAWQFGGGSDELAGLVLDGTKTAHLLTAR